MPRDLVLQVIEQVRGNALDETAKDLDKLAGRTDDAAGSAKDYSATLKELEARIASTRLKIQDLGAEFVATSEKATGKELSGERSLLRQLEKIRKELEEAAPDLAPAGAVIGAAMGARAGEGFAGSFFDSVGSLPSKLRGSLLVAAAGAAAATAPLLGASIAGAVTGTVGVGGIAGGIAAASKDPAVRAAAAAFGEDISAEFFSGGQAFVGPTIESLAILEQAFKDMDLGDSWERVAPFVTRIAEGIAGMGTKFMPGFNRALDAAGPALEILADRLPGIGDALGDMIGDISESEGALEGWIFVLRLVESTIRVAGSTITWLSNRFHDLVSTAIAVTGVMEDLPIFKLQELAGIDMSELNDKLEALRAQSEGAKGGLDGLTDAGKKTTFGMYEQGNAAHALADAVRRLHDEYSDYLGIQMGVDQANRRVAESLLDLKKTLRENGNEWRDNTEEGLENRAMLSAMVAALIQQRDESIAAGRANQAGGLSATDATTRFEAELDALRRLAVAAGISKEVLQDLVGDYYIRVHVTTGETTYSNALARAISGQSRISGFQHGGDPPIGDAFWVGEAGAELMRLSPRPHIYSHQESKAMMSSSASTARETAQTLATIVLLLKDLTKRPAASTINVYAPPGMSPQELSAVVSREQAWNN